ncbi:divalent cation tolerance protein CutA [Streptomyces sp. 1222.5]|uniref:divalent cation tolerance protein CutA n=1 Tax=Streptomyces sp. 1222.5 TaxID=1881026 RepID=UPI003D75471E
MAAAAEDDPNPVSGKLEAHLLEQHPWQKPEIAAVPIEMGSAGCLDWIAANTEQAK